MKKGYIETKVLAGSRQENQVDDLLQQAVENLINLRILFETGNNAKKRKIAGSIFPEKVVFDGTAFRTARESEAVALIYNTSKGFGQKKTAQIEQISSLCRLVAGTGIEPVFAP